MSLVDTIKNEFTLSGEKSTQYKYMLAYSNNNERKSLYTDNFLAMNIMSECRNGKEQENVK